MEELRERLNSGQMGVLAFTLTSPRPVYASEETFLRNMILGRETYLAFAPRWVGSAMAKCPEDVPWQRVINSKGEISPRPGAEEQRQLLEEEGVRFDERGRIDLKIFGWQSSSKEPEQPPLL